jgi:hypothetical protein
MTAALLLLSAAACFALDPVPEGTEAAWKNLFDYSRKQYEENHDRYERDYSEENKSKYLPVSAGQKARGRTRRSYRIPGLLAANAVNAVDIASAAIETTVQGADAGVTIAPLLLAGIASPGQVKLAVASLKEGKTRLGFAFSYEQSRDLETYADLGLEPCPRRPAEFEKALAERQCAFERVCASVIARLPAPSNAQSGLAGARALCGLGPDSAPAVRVDVAGAELVKAKDDLRDFYRSREPAKADLIDALAAREKDDLAAVSAFLPDDLDACHLPTLGDVYLARVWEEAKTSVGIQYAVDAFALTFGSSDPAATRGQPSRHDLRAEVDYSKGPLSFTVGLGYGSERTSVGRPFRLLLRPSAEVSLVVGAIGGETLRARGGHVNVVDGSIVPHFTVGLSITEENKGDFSETTSASITPYLAFTFSEKIVVRAGIPVTATRACRKAALDLDPSCDPLQAPAGATELQWTVPASIVTILKL